MDIDIGCNPRRIRDLFQVHGRFYTVVNGMNTSLFDQESEGGSHISAGKIICEQLEENPISSDVLLTHLIFANGFGDDLAHSILSNRTLARLMFRSCHLPPRLGVSLGSILSHNSRIKLLELSGCHFDDSNVTSLCKGISPDSALKKLNLTRNGISDRGAKAIGEMLRRKTRLFNLILAENCIMTEGGSHIGSGLRLNTSLGVLVLCRNLLGAEGTKAIADALKINSTLIELDIQDNGGGEMGALHIEEMLSVNMSLISVDYNRKTRGGASEDAGSAGTKHITATIEEQKKFFEEALNADVRVPWGRTRLLFVGQGRAGKTATVRSIMRLPFQEEWKSTIGATVHQFGSGDVENYKWRPVDGQSHRLGEFSGPHIARLLWEKTLRGRRNAVKPKVGKKMAVKELERVHSMGTPKAMVPQLTHTMGRTPETGSFVSNTGSRRLRRRRHSLSGAVEGNALGRRRTNVTGIEAFVKPMGQMLKRFQGRVDRDALDFTVWDFGGQEVFYALHHIFLARNGVYIIVFNIPELVDFISTGTIREGEQSPESYLKFWLDSVNLHTGSAPAILVGTRVEGISHRDLESVNNFLVGLTKECRSKVIPDEEEGRVFFGIDNRTYRGVAMLQMMIAKASRKLESVTQKVPLRWMAILDALYEECTNRVGRFEKHWLSLDRVKTHARKLLVGEEDVEEMLECFHELGVVFYLNNSARLRERVTLNPRWLLESLGKLIRDRNVHGLFNEREIEAAYLTNDVKDLNLRGVLSQDLLNFVWKGEEKELMLDLLKGTLLIGEFRLKDEKYFIVPSLLQNEVKKEVKNLKYTCFFVFKRLPTGVFERMVCGLSNILPGLNEDFVINKNLCQLNMNSQREILLQKTESNELVFSVSHESHAVMIVDLVSSILNRINVEIMHSALDWQVEFDDKGRRIPAGIAKKRKLNPWFKQVEGSQSQDLKVSLEL